MQPLKGVSIGKMMSLYPFDRLKQQAMDEAKTFVHYMKIQGNEPRQAESEFEVWGPFRERVRFTAETRNIEEGNPFSKPVIGFSGYGGWTHDGHKGPRKLDRKELLDSPDWKAGVVFMIRGLFTATRGHREETTGTVLVAGEGL